MRSTISIFFACAQGTTVDKQTAIGEQPENANARLSTFVSHGCLLAGPMRTSLVALCQQQTGSEGVDFFEALASDTLKVPIHSSGRFQNETNLLLTF